MTALEVDDIEQQLDWLIKDQQWETAGLMLLCHPGMCQHRNRRYGWTKLHWLCSIGGTPASMIDLTASLYPEAVSMQDTYLGDTCLHVVCRNSQFSSAKLQNLLKYCTPETLLIRNRIGGTALHSAANHNAVLSTLELLVDANPAVLTVTTHEGIHAVAALWLAYIQTIPGHMVVVRILNGETTVESQTFDRFWSKVEYLAVKYFVMSTSCSENLIDDTEKLQNYVLHGLLQCNVPINFIKVCLKYRPTTALAVDAAGNLPLHVLIENRPYRLKEREAMEACLEAFSSAAGIQNHSGDVPLQIAIRNKIPIPNGVDLLLLASPNTAQCRDSATGLYPFQLAAHQGSSAAIVNTTYHLLATQPDLVVREGVTNAKDIR